MKRRNKNLVERKFMKNNNEIQISFVPIELLEYNEGQIPGVPENPRTREDTKQRNLEKSIDELGAGMYKGEKVSQIERHSKKTKENGKV